MKSLLLTTILLATISVPSVAQDFDEGLAEIDVHRREAENRKRLLRQQLEHTEQRIKLLTEARTRLLSLQRFERRDTSMSDLHLAMFQRLGVPQKDFAESQRILSLRFASHRHKRDRSDFPFSYDAVIRFLNQ